MKTSVRERAALTAGIEKRLLRAMARRVPPAVHSDHLTVLGVVGAVGAGTGYALSGLSPHWLWLASAMLALNWFGDSLDGTLARVRNAQRPRYGYYLDHSVDAFTTVAIGVGIGLSPFVSLYVALGAVILYLLMSINVYLESTVHNVFRMDYGPVGPTEARILLVLGNTLLVGATAGRGIDAGRIEPVASTVITVGLLIMGVLLLWRFGGNLRQLGRAEPLERGGRDGEAPRGRDGGTCGGDIGTGDGNGSGTGDEPGAPERPDLPLAGVAGASDSA